MIENNGGRLGYPLIAMVDEAPVQQKTKAAAVKLAAQKAAAKKSKKK